MMATMKHHDLDKEFEELWATIRELREAQDKLEQAADKVIGRVKAVEKECAPKGEHQGEGDDVPTDIG